MILDYIALGALIIGALLVFYVFVFIHDLPHKVAKQRNHPHADAIGAACWLSLLTLHAIWPIVFIWSLTKQDQSLIDTGSASTDQTKGSPLLTSTEHGQANDALLERLSHVEARLARLESTSKPT